MTTAVLCTIWWAFGVVLGALLMTTEVRKWKSKAALYQYQAGQRKPEP